MGVSDPFILFMLYSFPSTLWLVGREGEVMHPLLWIELIIVIIEGEAFIILTDAPPLKSLIAQSLLPRG